MSDLREALERYERAYKIFEGGTIITSENMHEEAARYREFREASAECNRLGASHFVKSLAAKGVYIDD